MVHVDTQDVFRPETDEDMIVTRPVCIPVTRLGCTWYPKAVMGIGLLILLGTWRFPSCVDFRFAVIIVCKH